MLVLKCSLLNREKILTNVLKALALIEDYTEIGYMIPKVDILSIHSNMSLRRPKSMRNVNGLSLLFIDFYVPAHIPHFNSTETSLQLSENITLFVDCRIYICVSSAKRPG
jgi:hypothetical protein